TCDGRGEVPKGHRKLNVISPDAPASWQSLAAQVARGRAGAEDEILPSGPLVDHVLHAELPVPDRGDFIEEEIPCPVRLRMKLPGTPDDVDDVTRLGGEIEGEIEHTTLASIEKRLDQALHGRGLADLAGATECMNPP